LRSSILGSDFTRQATGSPLARQATIQAKGGVADLVDRGLRGLAEGRAAGQVGMIAM
jgi:hypothetical protein